jgi:poly-D-alanine transfer protein DltD
MNKKYLAILLPIICFLSVFSIFLIFPTKNYEQEIQEKVKKFLEDNPNANESYARDVAYHDLAIEKKDSSLCGKISTGLLKEDCLNFFKVNK